MAGIAIPTEKQLFSNRQLRSLIIPLIIEQALALSVGMIDTIMISSVGEAQVSGVSLVDMINNLIINVFSALATGGTVIVAQFLGAKEHKKAQQSAAQLLVVAFLIALAVMGGCLLWNESLISLFFGQIEADVRQASVTYFQITALSFPFIAVYNCCAALFRAIGNSRVAMYASAFSNILNLIGNYVMIHVFAFGVAGAAAATTFARFAAMLFMMVLLSLRT